MFYRRTASGERASQSRSVARHRGSCLATNLDDLACLRGFDLERLVLGLRACAEALRVETIGRPTIYEMTDELQTRGFVPERTFILIGDVLLTTKIPQPVR
jgi:hypothetical protein